jgi:hypothetical protein
VQSRVFGKTHLNHDKFEDSVEVPTDSAGDDIDNLENNLTGDEFVDKFHDDVESEELD